MIKTVAITIDRSYQSNLHSRMFTNHINPAYLAIFLHAFTTGWGKTPHPLKDELFDAFAMDNNIEKYCCCKQ